MTTSARGLQLFDKLTLRLVACPGASRPCASGREKQKHLEGFLHIQMSRHASLQSR